MKHLDTDRDVLPAWMTSHSVAGMPELNSVKKNKAHFNAERLAPDILKEFNTTQTVGIATELLNVAIIENDHENAGIAAQFLKNKRFLSPSLIKLLHNSWDLQVPEKPTEHPISILKKQLTLSNNNPLIWVDLSREYAIFGEKERSIKAMLAALHYANDHRWITRIGARVFVHFNEPDRAHYILLKNPSIKADPWLIATEMAVSRKANRQSKLLSNGRNLLESNTPLIHMSELASSFGTLELLNGAEKKAKGFFKQSLLAPNQNSLAQAKWAERNSRLKNLVNVPLDSNVVAYEAQYWEAYSKQNIPLAMDFAKAWYNQEPYSSGPAIAISYLAALLDDYKLLLQITTKGLIANPHNSTLKLNQIFAWIASNDINRIASEKPDLIDKFLRTLNLLAEHDDWSLKAHALANTGMFHYRTGNLETGRQQYNLAEEIYERHAPNFRFVLLVNHLREALISDANWAQEIMIKAAALSKNIDATENPGALFYFRKIEKLSNKTGDWLIKFKHEGATHLLADELSNEHSNTKQITHIDLESKFWLPERFSGKEIFRPFTLSSHPTKNKP
uniref:Tetratricopeptide repeat protein n=1 Tax=Pseudomonas zanjanensis TaxID=2745496 RepID=A0A923FAQ3_9PSED